MPGFEVPPQPLLGPVRSTSTQPSFHPTETEKPSLVRRTEWETGGGGGHKELPSSSGAGIPDCTTGADFGTHQLPAEGMLLGIRSRKNRTWRSSVHPVTGHNTRTVSFPGGRSPA